MVTNTQLGQTSFVQGVATDADHVYLTGYNANDTFDVIALNGSTGAESWRQSFTPFGRSVSSPSVGNGTVYVHQWGHSGVAGGNPSQYPYLTGMDAGTGTIRFATSHSGQWNSGSRPTVAGNQVFAAGGYYGGLDSYDAQTGARTWFAPVNQQYGWIPAADSERVYVYMGPASASPGPQIGTLYAFNRDSGSVAFRIENPADTITLYKGTVFLGDQNDALTLTRNQTITSFDLSSRSVRWRATGSYSGSMALDDGIVFAANDTRLDLLNEGTGATIGSWLVPEGQSLTGNLLVTDNLIFAQTSRSTYAVSRSSLQPVWSTSTVGDLALGDGLLLIGNNAYLTAFRVPEPAAALLLLAGSSLLIGTRAKSRRQVPRV